MSVSSQDVQQNKKDESKASVYHEPVDIAGNPDFLGLVQVYALHRFLGGKTIEKYKHIDNITQPQPKEFYPPDVHVLMRKLME